MTQARPVALTIAGSDSSGGAGIQADLKTFSVLGVYGASVLTALTAQNTRGVASVLAVPAAFITAQIDAVAEDLAIGAVKTGMLGDAASVLAVAAAIARHGLRPLVVDPVMVATSGDPLISADAVDALRSNLIPKADLVTPNLPEAAKLLGTSIAKSHIEARAQARALLDLGAAAVLLKGGHGTGADSVDVLASRDGTVAFERPRVASEHTHGTGCTLSAAIAAELAKGVALTLAVERAKDFVWRALLAGRDLGIGHGHGPVDHLHAIFPRGTTN